MNPINYLSTLIADGAPVRTANLFYRYHQNHPHIWKHFEKFALVVVESGKRTGAMAIMNRIRWEVEFEQNGIFKVNHNFAPYYARVFEIKYPQHKGFFKTCALKEIQSANSIC